MSIEWEFYQRSRHDQTTLACRWNCQRGDAYVDIPNLMRLFPCCVTFPERPALVKGHMIARTYSSHHALSFIRSSNRFDVSATAWMHCIQTLFVEDKVPSSWYDNSIGKRSSKQNTVRPTGTEIPINRLGWDPKIWPNLPNAQHRGDSRLTSCAESLRSDRWYRWITISPHSQLIKSW